MDPPKIVRTARRIRVMGITTAAWSSACAIPEIAVYFMESQGKNNAAKNIIPAAMATPPCTRMSAVFSFSISIN